MLKDDLLKDPCVRVWRASLGESWQGAFRVFVWFYNEVLMHDDRFRGMSPSELVEWQANAVGRDRFAILQLAQIHLNELPLRYKTKGTRLSFIRSLWLHNHAPFPQDRSFRFKSDIPPVEGNLTFEAFKRILHNCNKMYRAVFLMLGQGLLDESALIYISNNKWEEVLDHLTKNDGVFKIGLPGRKKNRNVKNFFTMLSTKSDWAKAYKGYMKSCPEVPNGALYRNERGQPLTAGNIQYYFHWRAVEAGVIKQFSPPCRKCGNETVRFRKRRDGKIKVAYRCQQCGNVNWASSFSKSTNVRYGINPHEIRDLMRSRWRASGAKIVVAEFIMQHSEQVDPNEYDKMKYTPGYPIQEYQKALPWLNIISQDPERVDRTTIDAELESYREENERLRNEILRLERNVRRLETVKTEDKETLDEVKKHIAKLERQIKALANGL